MIPSLKNNKSFGIYARLSREDQEDKELSSSIENQLDILKEELISMNLNCIKIYIDDGYSGKDMNRPGMQELITDIYDKKIDGIIVKDLSRIGRNLLEVGHFIEEFCILQEVRVISILDHYDSALQQDDDSIVLRSFVNDYYLKECREKQRKSYEMRKTQQLLIKHGRYGYDIIDGNLVINEEEASVIKTIFESYVAGIPPSKIASMLHENKIYGVGYLRHMKSKTTLNNDDPYFWNMRSINRIIHDDTYIGQFTNCATGNFIQPYTLENTHQAIISNDLFLQAQNLCASRKNSINADTYKFIYDGIHHQYFKYDRAKRIKRGNSKKTGLPLYKNLNAKLLSYHFSLNYDDTISIILNETRDTIFELGKNRNYIYEILTGAKGDTKSKLQKAKEDISKLEFKKKNLTSRFISGSITKLSYQQAKASIEVDLNHLKSEIQDLEAKSNNQDIYAYNRYIDELVNYPTIDMQLAKKIFNRIIVTKDEEGNPIFEFEYKKLNSLHSHREYC